jgi:RNA polymerase sigma factor (sigma-70 family)
VNPVEEDVPVTQTDAELLRAARTDAQPFRGLYDRYANRVHGYFLRRTRDDEAAHDLTAETFAQAWISRSRFRDEANGSAGPWLFAIARHVLAQSVRRRRLERAACERLGVMDRLDREPSTLEPDPAWLDGLDEAFEELPDGQRHALELRVLADLDYDGVAAGLGTSQGTARVRVARALSALRGRITNREMEATR